MRKVVDGKQQATFLAKNMEPFNIVDFNFAEKEKKEGSGIWGTVNTQFTDKAEMEDAPCLMSWDMICGLHKANPSVAILINDKGERAKKGELGYPNKEITYKTNDGAKLELV